MVGHTGVIPAAVSGGRDRRRAASARSCAAVHEAGGACVITADHGNADHMLEPDGSPNTAHSLNPVPLIVTVRAWRSRDAVDGSGGVLADVAPTVLQVLGIEQPAAMTGRSLIRSTGARPRRLRSAPARVALRAALELVGRYLLRCGSSWR